jgi:hypothetical protein
MIGMNDVNRDLYSDINKNQPGISERRQKALNVYYENTTRIIERLPAAKSKVIIQTPSIYDQTVKLEAENDYGVNDALKKCALFLQQTANTF